MEKNKRFEYYNDHNALQSLLGFGIIHKSKVSTQADKPIYDVFENCDYIEDIIAKDLMPDGPVEYSDGSPVKYDEVSQTFIDEEDSIFAKYDKEDHKQKTMLEAEEQWFQLEEAAVEKHMKLAKAIFANQEIETSILDFKVHIWRDLIKKAYELVLGERNPKLQYRLMSEFERSFGAAEYYIERIKDGINIAELFQNKKTEIDPFARELILYFAKNGPEFYMITEQRELTEEQLNMLDIIKKQNETLSFERENAVSKSRAA